MQGHKKVLLSLKKQSLNRALWDCLNYKRKSYPNISWFSFPKKRRIFLYEFRDCFILMVMLIGYSQFPSWLPMISYNITYNLCLPDIHKPHVYIFCFQRFIFDVFVQIHSIMLSCGHSHVYNSKSHLCRYLLVLSIRVNYCKLKVYSSNPQGI